MENYDRKFWGDKKCPPVNCRKKQCECGLEKIVISATLGDDSKDSPIAPKNGEYCNAIVAYEATGNVYIYSKEGIPTLVEKNTADIEKAILRLQDGLAQEILDRTAGDKTLQDEIDEMKNSPDVVDIVATYADLQAYDTSKLGDKDVIRVLADETHNGDSTYYRFNKSSGTFTYIGESKQYTDFVGTDGTSAGVNGLVPAPLAADAGKFLNASGSWESVQAGPTVVQTTGTSTTDVMSQNAVTKVVFGTNETYIIATNSWSALSASSPYDYQATVTSTYTIGVDTIVELINDNAVLFGNYGFAIGSISSQSVTIYSIGQPGASVTLKVNYKG